MRPGDRENSAQLRGLRLARRGGGSVWTASGPGGSSA